MDKISINYFLIQSGPEILGQRHNSNIFGSIHYHNGMKQTQCALTADCQLQFGGYVHPTQVNGVGLTSSLQMCLPLVKGQLASQLFHGQVCDIPSLPQLQCADKRPRVHFKCAICIWNLLLSTLKMRSKELSLSVKQAIIRLKKQIKPIREIARTLGMVKTTVWNILKKKERTGELSNTKIPGRPRKTMVVDDRRNLSLVKKTPFTTVGQIKNTLQEVGVCVSKSTMKRRLHQSEYRGFTTRCKPLVSLKNRKARLEFAKQHLTKPSQFWNKILWTDETKINLYQSDGKRRVWRRKGTAHDPKHTTSSVKHCGGRVVSWHGHVWL
uniref:Transposase Tc1-like domain-containing protein n=1 Tax=Leptobrachium leishanense TaxID=445787 RepID=A0A8C5MUE3_9ANUR